MSFLPNKETMKRLVIDAIIEDPEYRKAVISVLKDDLKELIQEIKNNG